MPPADMPEPLASPQTPPAAVRGRRVLLTGAAGLLGFQVFRGLQAHGLRVRALLRRPPDRRRQAEFAKVECALGDVRDALVVRRAVEGMDYVIHSAALPHLLPRPREQAVEINVQGTRNICRAALRTGVRRLVFTSSLAVLGPGSPDAPADETSPFARGGPHSAYYSTKRQAERAVWQAAGAGLPAVCLRPGYLLGPGDLRPWRTTNAILLEAARAPWLLLPPGGIHFLDAREAALAHVRALWCGAPGSAYVLAGAYAGYAEVARLVKRLLGRRVRGLRLPAWSAVALSAAAAVASGLMAHPPDRFTASSVQYAFISFHASGRCADEAFALEHRPLVRTVRDTLKWLRQSGVAAWLPECTEEEPCAHEGGAVGPPHHLSSAARTKRAVQYR